METQKLERIIHELATELITYEPLISATAPREIQKGQKTDMGMHRRIYILALKRGTTIELVAYRTHTEQYALEYMQRVNERLSEAARATSIWVIGSVSSARDVTTIGTLDTG